jgi:tetratricopeptide (TPR) repeat protein
MGQVSPKPSPSATSYWRWYETAASLQRLTDLGPKAHKSAELSRGKAMHRTFHAAAACVALWISSPAPAQGLDDHWAHCYNPNRQHSDDTQIARCTAIIESGQETSSNLSIAYYNRGNAYVRQKKDAQATADYDSAIRLNPQYAKAYYNRGNAHRRANNPERAIADYSVALQHNPQHVRSYVNRGNTYRDKGQLQRAIDDYNSAIRVDAQHARAWYNLGRLQLRMGRTSEGEANVAKARQLDPKVGE